MMSPSLPAPPGVNQPAPAKPGWWSKLRIPVLIVSLQLFTLSVVGSFVVQALQDNGFVPTPLIDLFVHHGPGSKLDPAQAYANRLRADAERLAGEGDYASALVRLDQAAGYDRRGDSTTEIQRERLVLRVRLGEIIDSNHPAHGGSETP